MGLFSAQELGRLLALPKVEQYIEAIDTVVLEAALTGKPHLDIPLKRVLTAPGKRLRPLLVCAIAWQYGRALEDDVMRAATATELVHVGSLVHDDIIDQASERRGRPTIHAAEGLPSALVVGDHLLACAGVQAAHVSTEAALLIGETISDLCDGELAESLDAHNLDRTEEALLDAIDGKTGALLSAACQLGCLVSGAPKDEQRAWGEYGQQFGRAFQLIDDVLDFVADPKLFGKPTGNDVREGVYTLPVILSLHGSERQTTQALLKRPNNKITKQLIADSSIQRAIVQARHYAAQARQTLQPLKPTQLAALPERYVEQALATLVASDYKLALGL